MAIPKDTATRYKKLVSELNRHRHLYHVLDTPEISDQAYDELEQELLHIEAQYPEIISPDSPSSRVGGEVLAQFKKVKHEVLQWSYNDAFSEADMVAFNTRVKKIIGAKD